MAYRNIFCIFVLFIIGCAEYKELIPNPEVISKEGQPQFLKNGDENFQLKKDDKYFVKFPRPAKNNFYLVLEGKDKPQLYSYLKNYFNAEVETTLTRSFSFTEGAVQKIFDENPKSNTISVYPIDSLSENYFWMIDTVRQDVDLALCYRYVQQWRYKFENDYDRYRTILADNTVDRTVYMVVDATYNTDALKFDRLIAETAPKNGNLQSMHKDLLTLERVFPPDIKETGDTAFATYTTFRSNVDNEILFQNNYLAVLDNLKKEKDTRDDIELFLKAAPGITEFLSESGRYPARITEKVKSVCIPRLDEILPHYDAILKNSTDIVDIGSHEELDNVPKLFAACTKEIPDDLTNLITFFHKYNEERNALLAVDNTVASLDVMAEQISGTPGKPYYSAALALLEKTQALLPETRVSRVEKYGKYKCAVMLDHKNNSAAIFVETLTGQLEALHVYDEKMGEIRAMFHETPTWPSDAFYRVARNDMEEIESGLSKALPAQGEPYSTSKIALWAKKRLTTETNSVKDLRQQYLKAEEIVPQINAFGKEENYRDAIRLLNANRTLGFLIAQYPDIDTLSLGHQTRAIAAALNARVWGSAEMKIDELFRDRDYVHPDAVGEKRNQYVKQFESELFQKVNLASRSSAELFIKTHEATFRNISALYKDSSFMPVYKLTFSSSGPKGLQQKKKQIDDYLAEMRTIRFPEAAIKELYKELTKNIQDQGVEKARAIVDHGSFYKGSDRQVKNLVIECDYSMPKTITKPSEYRKFFVLPSTNNSKGMNTYLLKLDMQIPSEAEFPVFDVNVAMPPELAQNAVQKAWFDELTINKKQIKNEGRFHITAPTSDNNYESQITPVQITKGSTNILEIRLKYNGFRVFEVSVMAQKPIIRK